MKLSDVMAAADLVIYAEVGLVLFLGAFLAVAARVIWLDKSDSYEQIQSIPLSDERTLSNREDAVSSPAKEVKK